MKPYMILYKPGPAWIPERPVWEQELEGHGNYHQHLLETGQLVFGGPYMDSTGGFAVVLAAPDQIDLLVEKDPAVTDGVFTVEVHALHMVFNRYVQKGLKDPGPGI